MFRGMLVIREFEKLVYDMYPKGLIPGGTHLCRGQEAVAVRVASAMRIDDYSTYTYRSHGHVLARGMDPEAALAEMMGKVTGCNRGRGGSMHLTDSRLGLYGCFAVVGAGLPVAVGLARAAQLQRSSQVSVTFFGDGATNTGAFHESMNLAAVWRAPVVFVCENNLYGEYTPIGDSTPITDLALRAQSYAMRSEIVDGNDVTAVHTAAAAAIAVARAGEGPTFLECKTYRQDGHSRSDQGKYRSVGEVEAWLARDPLLLARGQLLEQGLATEHQVSEMQAEVAGIISSAFDRAAAAPVPDIREATKVVQ